MTRLATWSKRMSTRASSASSNRVPALRGLLFAWGNWPRCYFEPVVGGGPGFFETRQFVRSSSESLLQPNIDFAGSPMVLRLCGIGGILRAQVTIIFPRRIDRNIHFEPLTCA